MKQNKVLNYLEVIIIISLAVFPALLSFPYRVNVFLSWEGAYRISEGQLPFRDFGLPMGGMYWVLPAIFFKIFGAQVITLVKAQVFINIISGLAFRSILKSVDTVPAVRFASVLLYCLSFSFFNFWPWYNHTVVVYGFVAVAFLLKGIFALQPRRKTLYMLLAALFTFFSFFTKQDGGGLIFFICLFILAYNSWYEKKWLYLFEYAGGTLGLVFLAVLLFSQYDFGYWFNHGQPPHNARVSGGDIVNLFLGDSQWLKFYFFLVLFIAVIRFKNVKSFLGERKEMIFLLLTAGVLCMAAIFQITSYTPSNSNIFFHSFTFAFILNYLTGALKIEVLRTRLALVLSIGVCLWWSHIYWNYMQRIFIKSGKQTGIVKSATGENVVGMHNGALFEKDTVTIPQGQWINAGLPTLKKIKMPEPTVKGIERIMQMDVIKNKKDLRILNMSELTFLAKEIPYQTETGPGFPLWYHLGVGMFNREADMFKQRIRNNYYDVVIFEYLPELNNFYPFEIRDLLKEQYKQVDSFYAPRNTNPGTIEVFVKK
ncbi:MAG: hypothetical protein ACTHMM_01745 [Agriterribacter sp.]